MVHPGQYIPGENQSHMGGTCLINMWEPQSRGVREPDTWKCVN